MSRMKCVRLCWVTLTLSMAFSCENRDLGRYASPPKVDRSPPRTTSSDPSEDWRTYIPKSEAEVVLRTQPAWHEYQLLTCFLVPPAETPRETVRGVFGVPFESEVAGESKTPYDVDAFQVSKNVAIVVEYDKGVVVRARAVHPYLRTFSEESHAHMHTYAEALADLTQQVVDLGLVLRGMRAKSPERPSDWYSDTAPFRCKMIERDVPLTGSHSR